MQTAHDCSDSGLAADQIYVRDCSRITDHLPRKGSVIRIPISYRAKQALRANNSLNGRQKCIAPERDSTVAILLTRILVKLHLQLASRVLVA